MEGKEVRFGIFNSALFATITTDASCGAVNAMHDSFTPLGGLVPALQHRDRRGHLRRRGRRPLRHADLRRAGRVHRRPHGRPHPGVPRQEDRGLRREARHARPDGARDHDPRLHRLGQRERLGPGRPQQRRPARLQRNPLRLQLVRRQQRQRLRRPHRQSRGRQSALQHHARRSRCSSAAS